jgi:hypothetical protein
MVDGAIAALEARVRLLGSTPALIVAACAAHAENHKTQRKWEMQECR